MEREGSVQPLYLGLRDPLTVERKAELCWSNHGTHLVTRSFLSRRQLGAVRGMSTSVLVVSHAKNLVDRPIVSVLVGRGIS